MLTLTRENALDYHRLKGVPGKLEILPTKPLLSQNDIGLAYSPGVAYPVIEIADHPELAYECTNKGNSFAVISKGTAILGLGDRGPLASKPVMKGKAVLFKKFAGIDSIDIELDSRYPDVIVNVVSMIAQSFGGINLDDIKSPECFYIEKKLHSLLDIPGFHDDQHGTAIILGAALLTALELSGKKIDEMKIVFSGAGAAAIASANHLVKMGAPQHYIWFCDKYGLVYNGRKEEMFPEKEIFAQGDQPGSLAQTLEGADMLIGLSVGNIISGEMISRMWEASIFFPMANPDPEFKYDVVKAIRPDAIVGTGRSDFPNQVNNLPGFPFIFGGALDVRAKAINDEMKIAASLALSALAKEDVPHDVLTAYDIDHLDFTKITSYQNHWITGFAFGKLHQSHRLQSIQV